jgi:hypothetical protein
VPRNFTAVAMMTKVSEPNETKAAPRAVGVIAFHRASPAARGEANKIPSPSEREDALDSRSLFMSRTSAPPVSSRRKSNTGWGDTYGFRSDAPSTGMLIGALSR